jgi:hypothetical protein
LEIRLYRTTPLSDKFISVMADIVLAHIDIDEQRQRAEALLKAKENL